MAKKLTSDKAKEILHDKSVHGHPLTDKQRKFFGAIAGGAKPYQDGGWLDKFDNGGDLNYNDSSVSVGPNFEGAGYDNGGRAYNGAWGGTMQMGGALPGATGMMYARIGAPDNGKYAKKTQASAQNGTEMEYYQHGLDFKPKSISDNGKLLHKAQLGISTGISSGTTNPTTKNATKEEIRDIELNKILDKQGSIKKAEPKRSAVSKAWATVTNPMTALEYKVRGQELPEHFDRGARNPLDYAVDMVNPYQIVNSAASIPGNIAEGNLGEAALNALAIAPVLSEMKGVKAAASELSKAKNLREAAGYLIKDIPVEKSLPRLAEGELKTMRQIQEIPKMAQAGKSRAEQIKFALENNIPDAHFERIFEMPKKEAQHLIDTGFGERPVVDRQSLRERFANLERTTPRSMDEFAVSSDNDIDGYMDPDLYDLNPLDESGNPVEFMNLDEDFNIIPDEDLPMPRRASIPQDYINSLRNANTPREGFTTSKSNIGDKITKAEIKARGKVQDLIENATQSYPYYSGSVEEKVPSLFRNQEKSLTDISRKVAKQTEDIPSGTVYTGSLNTSHNSWLPQVKQVFNYKGGTPQFTGYKPMNALGYLSQARVPEEDIVKYLNTEMDELVKRGKLPENVQRPFMKKGHPMLPQYAIKQHKEGGIVDPMGQWAHPGKVTTIPSNEITMEGVDYDVLGVSNTGDKKLMKPGKNYKFEGSSVTEYPKGGWLNKYK